MKKWITYIRARQLLFSSVLRWWHHTSTTSCYTKSASDLSDLCESVDFYYLKNKKIIISPIFFSVFRLYKYERKSIFQKGDCKWRMNRLLNYILNAMKKH